MSNDKKKYTPPLAFNLAGPTVEAAQAFNCKSGSTAGQLCDFGAVAGGQCNNGRVASQGCGVGIQFVPLPPQCKSGFMATSQCRDGMSSSGSCRTGSGVMG